MHFSVVVATYNRRDLLTRTLPTVLSQDFPTDEYEVIVVSDGSNDGTEQWLHTLTPACRLTILTQENRGQSAALNAGIRQAGGDLVLLLDDDIVCSPNLLREHARAHEQTSNALVLGPIYVSAESVPGLATEWTRQRAQEKFARLASRRGDMDLFDGMAGANCSVPRRLLLACHGFDEECQGARALGLRLARSGVVFRFHAAARTEHIFVKSADDLVRKDLVRYGRNEVLLSRQYPEYRRHCMVATIGEGPWWKRMRRTLAARCPIAPDPLLAACYRAAEKLRQLRTFRNFGMRMLEFRLGCAMLRSASATAGSWRQLRREFGVRLPVLVYHHIGPPREGINRSITISRQKFERHIDWLARHGYHGITTAQWDAWLHGSGTLPEKPVLITLDDGYADTAQFAFPILERYGFPAVMYVVTGLVGRTNLWDGGNPRGTLKLLSDCDIRYWASRGFEFGAHTRTHADLTSISGDSLRDEVLGSGQDLQQILAASPRSFAYPWGRENAAARACVAGGFRFGFNTQSKLNVLSTHPAGLSRTTIWPYDTLLDLRFHVSFGLSPIYRVRNRVRGGVYKLCNQFCRPRRATA